MNWRYILAGWEGSAHDAQVLSDAQFSKGFTTSPGKYWLGDAGYSPTEFVLTPYRSVRYHLKEHLQAKRKPESPKELFNLRHWSMRNVVERIFGVFEGQWQTLNGSAYPLETHVNLVLGLAAVHDFARAQGELNEDFTQGGNDETTDMLNGQHTPQIPGGLKSRGTFMMEQKRDKMAENMWRDYINYVPLSKVRLVQKPF